MYIRDSPNVPPTYSTYTVTGKSFSISQDTVYYTYDYTAYTLPGCQNCPAHYDTVIGVQSIHPGLSDTVGADMGVSPQYSTFGCIDTTGFTGTWVHAVFSDSNLCNVGSIEVHSETNLYLDDSCYIEFEPIYAQTVYAAGLGSTYDAYNASSQGCGSSCIWTTSMIFYIKGPDSCGLRFMVPTPVANDPRLPAITMSIAPNPFSGMSRIGFTEPQDHATATLTNVLGERVWTKEVSGKEFFVDGAHLPSGAYFLHVESGGKTGVLKLLRE